MYKLVAIYKVPKNVAAFDEHYRNVHTPLVKKIPGLRNLVVNKVTGAPGGKSHLHLIAELCFETKEDFDRAMKSEENKKAGKDLMGFAGDIVSIHFAQE